MPRIRVSIILAVLHQVVTPKFALSTLVGIEFSFELLLEMGSFLFRHAEAGHVLQRFPPLFKLFHVLKRRLSIIAWGGWFGCCVGVFIHDVFVVVKRGRSVLVPNIQSSTTHHTPPLSTIEPFIIQQGNYKLFWVISNCSHLLQGARIIQRRQWLHLEQGLDRCCFLEGIECPTFSLSSTFA